MIHRLEIPMGMAKLAASQGWIREIDMLNNQRKFIMKYVNEF